MAGKGDQVGQYVLIVYNMSPIPFVVRAVGILSTATTGSYWIIPGYYYSSSIT